ncbi:alpha/beta hydrolase [Ruicaihuangia caeni]
MRIDADAVLWSAAESEREGRPLLVVMHGLGSNEGDLFSLTPYLPKEPVVASLRAPNRYGGGWSWFEPNPDDEARAREIDAASAAVLEWLDAQAFTSVGLLGFSQGGAMSAQLMRHRPEQFGYAINLSGFVVPTPHEGDAALAERKPPVFWGMGSADQVINPRFIEYTREWLPEHSTLTYRPYPGMAHEVVHQELLDIAEFMAPLV